MLMHMGGNVLSFAFAVPGYTLLMRAEGTLMLYGLINPSGEDVI